MRGAGERDRVCLVGYVRYGERGLVRAEADLLPRVLRIGSLVNDAHRIVRVTGACSSGARVLEAPDECGTERIIDVDHVEAAPARLAPHARSQDERGAALLVDGDVVRARESLVQRVGLEGGRHAADIAKPREVEDLHAVPPSAIGYHQGMGVEHFDVTPDGRL